MTEKLAKKAVKMPKLPKSLGAVVDKYHDLREQRLEANREVKAMQEVETAVKDHIIDNVAKGDGGAVGKRYKAIVATEDVPVVEDWDKLYAHIKRTGNFDLLNKALNAAAVRERWENGKKVPGVGTFKTVKLSVTKV